MKTLVLCRHAKSDWPTGIGDLNRPLKERGIKNAHFVGNLLADQGFSPDLIISSPANRALSTARLAAQALAYDSNSIRIEESVYYEGVESLLSLARSLPDSIQTVMIFGHNPTMENAAQRLLASQAPFYMPTSGMACFESHSYQWNNFSTSNAHLRWFLIPRFQRKNA